MSPRAKRYLELLEADPGRRRAELYAEIDGTMAAGTVKTWRASYPEFKEAERLIRDRWRTAQRIEKRAKASLEAAVEEVAEKPIEERFERFLVNFAAIDDRVEAVEETKRNGFEIEWEDVETLAATDEGFRKRFDALWNRSTIRAEDHYRRAAAAGKLGVVPKYLAAAFPDKYGSRMRVDHRHSGVVRLEAGHARLVEQQKESFVRRYQRKALAAMSEKVVEGEVVQ